MKIIFTVILLHILATSCGQVLPSIIYRDTINHFIINIPAGWRYGINKNYPHLKLISYRTSSDSLDKSHETFNVNIMRKEGSSLSKEFDKIIAVISNTREFTLLKKDTITIHGQTYKWFIESHKNNDSAEPTNSMVFITYAHDRVYILTLITLSKSFSKYQDLFLETANSFLTNDL